MSLTKQWRRERKSLSLIHATIDQKLMEKDHAEVLIRLCNVGCVSAPQTELSQQYAHASVADCRESMQHTYI